MYIFLVLFFTFLSAHEVPEQPYFNAHGALVLPDNDFKKFTANPELKKARATYLYDKFLNDPKWHDEFAERVGLSYSDIILTKYFFAKSEDERCLLKETIIAMYPTPLFRKCSGLKCPYSNPEVEKQFIDGCSDALARFISEPTDRPLHLVLYASGCLGTEGRILLKFFQNPSFMKLSKNLIVHCIDPMYESVENGGSLETFFMMPSFKKLLKEGKPAESKFKIKGVSFNTSVEEFLNLLAISARDENKDRKYYINPSLLVFGIDFDKREYLKTGSVTHLQQLLAGYQDASVVLALQQAPGDIAIVKDRAKALKILQRTQNSLSGSLTKNTKLFIKFTKFSMVAYIFNQQHKLPFSILRFLNRIY